MRQRSRRRASRIWKRRATAGVCRITSHGARHTAGSSYAVTGAGQKVVGAPLGHGDRASTERCTYVAQSATAALVKARWLRLGGGEGGK
jgi:integrase